MTSIFQFCCECSIYHQRATLVQYGGQGFLCEHPCDFERVIQSFLESKSDWTHGKLSRRYIDADSQGCGKKKEIGQGSEMKSTAECTSHPYPAAFTTAFLHGTTRIHQRIAVRTHKHTPNHHASNIVSHRISSLTEREDIAADVALFVLHTRGH
jgi:hypothetical protein